jgi:pimeloyl-ACP methyl ester carboxylesterase
MFMSPVPKFVSAPCARPAQRRRRIGRTAATAVQFVAALIACRAAPDTAFAGHSLTPRAPQQLTPRISRDTVESAVAESAMVNFGGRRLFARWAGSGTVTVVLEAGQGASSGGWAKVFPKVARLTRTVTYDRAGLGRSDSTTAPITPQSTLDDLGLVLGRTGQRPPYLLVGWSQGAIYVRLFARAHPRDVAALLLVDPAPDGLLDWIRVNKPAADFARADAEMRAAGGGVTAEWLAGPQVFAAGKAGWPLPPVPVTIISATDVPPQPAWWSPPMRAYMRAEAQAMAARVPRCRLVDAERSGHFVPGDRPDLVVDEVARLLRVSLP